MMIGGRNELNDVLARLGFARSRFARYQNALISILSEHATIRVVGYGESREIIM